MGKKHKAKSFKQNIIRDDILLTYIEDTDDTLIKTEDIVKHLDLLVENNNASCISGTDDTFSPVYGTSLKYICKYMCSLNKDIEKHVYKKSGHKLLSNVAYIPKEYEDISKYLLYPGIYYAFENKESSNKYLVLIISSDKSDQYIFNWSLYFVGKKCLERRTEFLEKMNKFNDKLPFSGIDRIEYLDGRSSTEAIFKTFDQMVFENKENIIKYIDNWKKNIPKYNEYGMIPKLSILLYGSPGGGKSTFCKALAKYLDIHVVKSLSPQVFNIDGDESSRKGLGFNSLNYNEAVFSIDDIDTVCTSRDDDKSKDNNKSLSVLLEFLDNPPCFYYKADDGKYYLVSIVCATTNYIDRLDKAVKRAGRFDLKIEMKKFNRYQAQEMCDMYDLKLDDIYHGTIDSTTEFVPAEIQALCMENIDKHMKDIHSY